MSILNITKLTSTPRQDIADKTNNAIEEYEKENQTKLTEEQRQRCHDSIDNLIEDFEENGKVSEALSFVDNLIVNHDYYTMVKEIVNN